MPLHVKRLPRLALLLALSLILYALELMLPFLPVIPGLKLGLSNVVTLFLLWYFPFWEVVLVLVSRILLGSFFTGGLSVLVFSLAGGLSALLGSAALRHIDASASMISIGIAGAILHHTGQMVVAALLLMTTDVLYYYPFLLLASLVTGGVTGYISSLVGRRLQMRV